MSDLNPLIQEFNLTALAIIGSRARGDRGEFSDLDLIGVGQKGEFHSLTYLEQFTELHICSDITIYKEKPSWWYALQEMKIVLDDGSLAKLFKILPQWYSTYKSAICELEKNRYWLESSKRKLQNSQTELQINYEVTTSFWQILSGMFLIRDLPIPANSDMFRLAPKVIGETRFTDLLTGNYLQKKAIALELIAEVICVVKK
ncbi:MAG: hypothetical protein RLZZ69_2788 [Cyanobacteriota bacterium]